MKKTSPIRFEDKTKVFILADEAVTAVEAAVDSLNPEQKQAVLAINGPVLVDAGAGTGKTKVLTTRIARLIALGYAVPERILAVTFTNKASVEMRERLAKLIGDEAASEVSMGSFHAVSLAMLRKHALEAGLKNHDFRVFDDGDQLLAMHTAMENCGMIDIWRKPGASQRDKSEPWNHKAQLLLDQVQAWKDEGRTIDDVERELALSHVLAPAIRETIEVYRAYQSELQRRNAVDFADIILLMVNLFRHSPSVREHWANRFSYILVDEFQDTDGVQYEWIEALASGHRNLFVVGDLDQSIYEWRNAKPVIFREFPDRWKDCEVIRLHRNYRSTQPILDLASMVAEKGKNRAQKARLSSGVAGDPVELKSFDTSLEEAQWIADDVHMRLALGAQPGSIAILFRQAKDMPVIEQALAVNNIPYSVVSGTRFHKREEVKDILAWISVAINPEDEISLFRVTQRPESGIEDAVFDRALTLIKNATPTEEAFEATSINDALASQASKDGLYSIARIIRSLKDAVHFLPVGEVIRKIVGDTGYVAWARRTGLAEDDLEDVIEALIRSGDAFEGTAGEFLQHFALLSDSDTPEGEAAIRLSTVHASKGLEFDVVYTPCLEEGILPNDRALKHASLLEEERHILYVALTRAKAVLYPSFARNRRYKPSSHSRFLEEIDGLITDEHRALRPAAARSTNRYATTKTIKRIKLVPGRTST